MTSSTNDSQKTFLERAYALTSTSGAESLYDEWAESYDEDLSNQQYASPSRTIDTILANIPLPKSSLTILDAGCGTGLLGDGLMNSRLAHNVVLDGCDISPGMLKIASAKNIYRRLDIADLSKNTAYEYGSYNVVACCGTLTKGHVGVEGLVELVRIAALGGLVVATVHSEIWQSGGFDEQITAMEDDLEIEVVSKEEFGVVEGSSKGCFMLVLRKKP